MLLPSLRKLRIASPSPPLEEREGERRAWAFTLIELMVVIAILGIILTVSIPAVYRYFHPNPLQKALDEILEACRDARELAVLQTRTTALVIDLRSKSISVRGASAPPPEASADYPELAAMAKPAPASSGPIASTRGCQLSDKLVIEGLGINGLDYTEDEQAEIRFYPKGTSDEFKLVLRSEDNEHRMIFLDPITGHADFEVDPQKFERHR